MEICSVGRLLDMWNIKWQKKEEDIPQSLIALVIFLICQVVTISRAES